MNLERTLEELGNEPVPDTALPDALSKLRRPHRSRPLWLLPTALTTLAILTALWPKAHSDEAWASALKNLKEAKYIHIVFKKSYGNVEAWKAGDKMRRLYSLNEMRYNGTIISERVGLLTSVRRQTVRGPFTVGLMDLGALTRAEDEIESKHVAPRTVTVKGIQYNAYTFILARVFGTMADPPGSRHFRGSEIGFQTVTAYVDPQANRIVELDEAMEFAGNVRTRMRGEFQIDSFKATVDYPDSLDEAMFDPPAGAFDYDESKRQVSKLLAGSLGVRKVGGQRVDLTALLFDGINIYAVWKGCPADYGDRNRFKVDGDDNRSVPPRNPTPIRGFSSGKCLRPATASTPFCMLQETVSKPLPATVEVTLPVFAPDHSRPYFGKGHRILGYHSRLVGWTEFHNVPVTPINPLDFYERQFGLLNNFW